MVPDHFGTSIDFTSGNVQIFNLPFDFGGDWVLEHCEFIAFIQDNTTKEILQGTNTEFTGLLPMFSSNVTEGPAHLGVQFTSNSFPLTGIESWEWDFDGDGVFDSTQENPYHLYTEPGSYDVTLRIGVGGEYEETTAEDYITVTNGSDISGQLSGIWVPDNTYTITGDVNIADTDMLIISPDTEIYIENDAQFSINGTLQADASTRDEEPIIFTSNSSWQGFRFNGTQANNIIANCEISKATVCAILIENDSSLDIIGNKIYDNSSTALAAAIDVTSSPDVLITQNIIANNFSSNAIGGIRCTNASIEITNNLIVNNSGTYGAFILQNNSDIVLTNNTIANNESNGTYQYLFFILNSEPVIKNCIIIDSNSIFFGSGDVDVTYTCISGGYTGTGNIDEDPLFIAPSGGDGIAFNGLNAHWWLQEGSPCIDAGDPDAQYNDPDGTRNDMGAYGDRAVVIEDVFPPTVTGHNPASNATEVPMDTNIVVSVRDNLAGVNIDSLLMTVEGITIVPSIGGTPAEYILTYDPPVDFNYGQEINVTIDACDLAIPVNVMNQYAYSFIIEQSKIPFVRVRTSSDTDPLSAPLALWFSSRFPGRFPREAQAKGQH